MTDRARCQPCLEQSAVPLLHMLWPKLLKLQRTQVWDHLLSGKLAISLQCVWAYLRRAVEPRAEILGNRQASGINMGSAIH